MASQLPRPWFRLGSMTRPTTAPNPEQSRPVPARVRPPIIRPAALTDPAEPTTPQRSKSPPPFSRPASLTPPVKSSPSPLRALPSPSTGQGGGTAMASPAVIPSSPKEKSSSVVGSPKGRSTSSVVGSPKGRSTSSVVGSPKTINSKQPSPFPSPSIPKSIPSVPTPYQSPKPKTFVSPPSPLVLPPPQLQSVAETKDETIPQEVERKTVVFQKVMDKPSQAEEHHLQNITNYRTHTSEFDKNGKQESNKGDDGDRDEKETSSKKKGATIGGNNNYKRTAFDHDNNTRVITMAGENKGAFMEINLSSEKNNSRHQQQQQIQDNNTVVSVKDSNKSINKTKGIKTRNVLPMRAFFNSNVQGINNSILMDSKFSHHDPGIHLVFSSLPTSPDDEDDQQHQ
ncbi:probable serine/threonine-protein kinase samkC isoform X2 [Cucumis sativus]|uniref:probable serine/threonine-protein kinase samkC isoform X2 n=1 Tax=Cucumis sativus TaxID=3659 RepID=UPI0002B4CDBF|nr:probable serine/threonine-protein kinase samkC isoform X2 [Cucumis sativus]KAE8646789.1 hypothetical protein Csa_005137 [Cucumis sativus]